MLWNLVEDLLPKEHEQVLVIVEGFFPTVELCNGRSRIVLQGEFYRRCGWHVPLSPRINYPVIAWMPIPGKEILEYKPLMVKV